MAHERCLLAAQGYMELDMPGEALNELDALPRRLRETGEVLQLRLIILMRLKRWLEAEQVCVTLREVLPEGTVGFIHGAFCLHELGRTREAKELLLSGPEVLRGEACYHYNLGCYDAVLGNEEEALRHLHVSFELDGRFREIAKGDPDLARVSGVI